MKIPTKSGEKVSPKEFMKRWKQGMKDVTPRQMGVINIFGSVLVLSGVLIGLVTTFLTKTWWLFIILIGSLFLTAMSFLSTIQKQMMLNEFEKQMKGGSQDE